LDEEKKVVDTWRYSSRKEDGTYVIEKENKDFETYYKESGILPLNEWDAFYNKLKEPLDICFRINSIDENFD
jgi:hypothetical protein